VVHLLRIDRPTGINRRFSFRTVQERLQHREELEKIITTWTGVRTASEVMIQLQGAGITSGVVQNCEDLFKDPQVAHRHYFKALDHREMGEHPYLSTSYLLSDTPPEVRSAAPLLGEHTEFVLKKLLGCPKKNTCKRCWPCPDVRGKRRG